MIEREKSSKHKTIIIWTMGILILIPGLFGFGEKLYQFFVVLFTDDDGRFALIPIATYLLLSVGFVFLIIWGIMKGMISDIEGPKYTMMENEEKLDLLEGNPAR